MTAEEVIEQARELDTTFTHQRHPISTCLRYLDRLQRRLISVLTQFEPRSSTAELVVALPLPSFDAGHDLAGLQFAELHDPAELTLTNGETCPIKRVDFAERFRTPAPAFWIQDGFLWLVGRAEYYTKGFTSITLTYTPEDSVLLKSSVFVLPDSAEDTLVNWLADFMAGRSTPEELSQPRGAFTAYAEAVEAKWRQSLRHRIGPVVMRTPEGR